MTQPSDMGQEMKRAKGVVEILRSWIRGIFDWMTGESFGWTDWIVLGGYAVLISFGIWHHEPWSDEAYAWVIARDSDPSAFLNTLFFNYENHPGLQHLLLFPLAKLGFPYEVQAVLNGLLAVAVVLLFLKKAVLPRITKYLFIFSFYMAFEYALIARPYTLAIFFIFCIAAAYPYRFRAPLTYGVLVFLLFNADYISFALGVAILLTYGLEWYGAHRKDRRVLAAFLIMLVAAVWIFTQGVLVPPDHYDAGVRSFYGWNNFFSAMRKALFPHGPNLFIFEWLGPFLTPLCALFFLVALGVLFRNATAFLGLFLTLLEFFYLFTFKRGGDLRHFGFLLVILLFGLWISKTGEADQPLNRFWKGPAYFSKEILRKILIGTLTACLLIELPFTLYAYVLEYTQPFSGAKQMGAIIRALDKQLQLKEKGYVIATWLPNTTGVAAYLPSQAMWNACMERPIGYYPATKELRACEGLSYQQLLERLARKFPDLTRLLLLAKRPLPFESAGGYRFFKIAETDPRVFGYMYETFFLYGIEREVPGGGPR